MGKELLESSTPEAYTAAHERMSKFLNEENVELLQWLKWWHERRMVIFRAFTGQHHPKTNSAEVVHASWENRGEIGLSLRQAAEFDTRDSLITNAELEEMKHVAKGKGCGPDVATKSKRQKKNEVNAADRSGRDLIDFGAKTARGKKRAKKGSILPVKVGGSDAPAKRKKLDDQKMFQHRMEKAKSASFLIRSTKVDSSLSHSFRVTNSSSSTATYDVKVCHVPSCTCSNYNTYGHRVLCEHIMFICLIVLKGDAIGIESALKARYLDEDTLKSIFATQIHDQFKIRKPNPKAKRNFTTILQTHQSCENEHTWVAHVKIKRCARCTNAKCQAVLRSGTQCLVVNGALAVICNTENVREQKFYFCLNDSCHKYKPAWTNIKQLAEANLQNELSSMEMDELRRKVGL